MRVTSNQYSDAVSNMVKRKIYSDLSMQLTNAIVCYIAHCFRIMIILIDKESQIQWLIDWLIDWYLTSSEQFFSYIQDENI